MRRRKIDRPTVSHEPPGSRPQPVGARPTLVGHARYFIALVPDAGAAHALARLGARLAAAGGGRPQAAADIHLTLAFIGARDAGFGERLADALAPVHEGFAGAPLALPVLGRFGRSRRPALFWAGPDARPAWLGEVAAQVDRMLRAMPCEFDERALVPHLTLLRDARPDFSPDPTIEPPVRVASWRLAIGRSRPAGERPRYAWSEPGDRHQTVKALS